MTYGWLHGDDDRGVGTMGELVAIGVSHGRNIRHRWCIPRAKYSPSVYPTGEIFAIDGVGFAPTPAPIIHRGVGELVAIDGVSHGRNIRHGCCPTGEIFAIGGVSHGRNIRHKWRGFRPYVGIDNTSWHGRIGRHRCIPRAKYSPSVVYPTGEIFAIGGVGFAPTPVSTIIVAAGVPSPHQPCRQFGLVRFAYRWIDLCAGRMAD